MSDFCYRHPETEARRRCYQCRRPICPACQIKLDRHIFCTEECHQLWKESPKAKIENSKKSDASPELSSLSGEVQKIFEQLKSIDRRMESIASENSEISLSLEKSREAFQSELEGIKEQAGQSRRLLSQRAWAYVVLIVFLIGGGLLSLKLSDCDQSGPITSGIGPAPAVAAIAADTIGPPNMVYEDIQEPLSPPTLELTTAVVMLQEARIDIGGYAPGAVAVTLYLDNAEHKEAQVAAEGFLFSQVPLKLGKNVIQVKATDAKGNVAFSMARILDRQSASRALVRIEGINRMRGPRDRPWLALTIDAGSSNRRAEKILDVLQDKNIKTTFFLTGRFIERYPEVVRRIVADGHEVGNHTYSHPHCTSYYKNRRNYSNITEAEFKAELTRTARLYKELTGKEMAPWWRAPFGEHNLEIRKWAEEVGFKHVDWTRTPVNHDMLDWISDPNSKNYLDRDALLKRLLGIDRGEPDGASGGIILTHLGSDRSRDFLDEVLPAAIDGLRAKGYEFVKISKMFE